jgi:hypothetical protein
MRSLLVVLLVSCAAFVDKSFTLVRILSAAQHSMGRAIAKGRDSFSAHYWPPAVCPTF